MSDSIKVAIKVRPLIKREKDDNLPVQWDVQGQTIFCIDPETKRRGEHSHVFDHIFGMDADNARVFDVAVKPIVDATVNGFNGTIFAYGQTSSGKTYTMMGTQEEPGIIPMAVENIFDAIANTSTREFLLRVSYLEIYNEKVNDLLHKDGTDLKIHEDSNGQVIVNCKEEVTNCPQNVLSIMKKGEKNRRFGETNMNDRSSRSHTIFRITIESRDAASSSDGAIQVSQLNLVDLAGSERVRQTGATGDRFKEGRHINLSLTSLSLVIKQLSESKEYVNFRDSKLTRILQASLGGNAMTTIICAVTPAALEETQCTLSFATRAKCIKNKPKLNEVVSDAALLKRFAKLIEKLSSELAQERQANRCGEVKEMESKLQEKDQYIQLIEDRMQLLKTKIVSSANSVENLDFKTKSRRRRTWCGPSNPSFLNHSGMLPTIQELPTTENTISDWKAAQSTKNRTIIQAPLNNINEKFQTKMEDFELELIESERNWEMGRFSSDSEDLEDNYYITKRKRGGDHVKFLDDVSVYPFVDNERIASSPEMPELSTPPQRRGEEEEDTGTPKEVLRDRIANLANEYKTLQEFTTLEKQLYTTETVETTDSVQYEIKYFELESKYNAAIQENEVIKKRLESLCRIEESHKLIESEKNQLKMDMEEKLVRLKKLEEERTDYECQIELLKSKHKMREKELETSLQIAWTDSANVADNQKSTTSHLQSLVDNLMKEVEALKEKLETNKISSAPEVLSTEVEQMRKTVEEYDILIETERRDKRKLIEELEELKKSLDRQSLINRSITLTRNDKSLNPCERSSSINENNFNTSELSEKVICENLCDSVHMDAVQLNLNSTENEQNFAEITPLEFKKMNLELRTTSNAKCLELESIEMHKYENEIQNLKSYIENLEHFIKNIQTENEDLKNQLHNQSQNLEDNIDDIKKRLIQQEKITDTLEKDKNTLTQCIGQLSQVKSESIVTTKSDSVDKPKSSNEKEDTEDYSSIFTNASYFDEMDVSLTQDTTLLKEITGNGSYFEDDKTACNATMVENTISELEDSNKHLEVIKTDLSSTSMAGEDNLSYSDIINKLHKITNAKMLLEDKNAKIAMELQLKIQESDEIKNDVQGLRLGIEKLQQTIHLLTTENMEMSNKLSLEKDRAREVEAQYQEQIEDLHRRISKIDEDKVNLENQLKISQENLVNSQNTSLPNMEDEAREKIMMYQEKIDLLTTENIELSTNLMDRIDELDKLKEDQVLLHNHKCSDIDAVQELRVQLESITRENTELSKNLMEKIEESDSLKHAYELLEKTLATPVKDMFPELKNESDRCLRNTEAGSSAGAVTSLQKKEQFEAASQTENCEESQINIEDLKFSLAKLREENVSLLNKVEALQHEAIALKSELLTNDNGLKEELELAKQCITKEIGFLKPGLEISTLLTKTVGELLRDFIKIIMTKEQEIITKVKEDFKQERQNMEDQKSQSADAVRRTTIWANELEADIEKLQTEISQQEKVNVTLKCEIDRLENDLKESNHEKQLLQEKIGVLENDFMNLQIELSKQSNSNNKQDEEVNAIQERERIALAASKNRELELQNSIKSVKDQLNQKIEALTYALEQQRTKNLDLKSNLEGLQATESQLKSIIDLKSTELIKLQQRVVTLEMENAQMILVRNQLNEENENKTKHIEEITSILKIKCDEMSEYKTKLESIVPECEIYKEQIKERKQYAEKCKHESEQFKQEVEKELNLLNDKLCDEKIKNGSLLSQLADLNDKNKLLTSEIEEQKERCEELEKTNEKLNKKVRNSTSNFKVEAQIEDLKDQNEMLRNNAEGASNRITELLEVKNSITKDFVSLQEKYRILLEEKSELDQLIASNNRKSASSDLQLSEICNQLESQILEKKKISLELEATKVIVSQKDKDLTIAKQEIERLNLANKELDQEAEELAQKIQEDLAEIEKLRNELFDSQNKLKSISTNVTDKIEGKEEGRGRKSFQDVAAVEVLIQQNKELRQELETLGITTDFLRKENVELKAKVAELESQSYNNSRSTLLEVANSSSNALSTDQLPSLAKKVREMELEIVSKNGKIATLELQILSENFPYQKKCRDLEENLSAFKHKNAILKEEVKNLQKTMGSVSAIDCEACKKRQSNRRDQSTQCLPEHKTYLSGTSSGFVDEYAKLVKLEKENKLMRDLCRSRMREIQKLGKEISKQELIISEKSMVETSLLKKLSEYEMTRLEKFRVQTTSPIEESKNNSPDKNIRSLPNRSKSPREENVKRALKENLSFNILDGASAVKSNHISSIWTHYP
ncbi:centromere-associated protein E isoform X2 [Diprion similis]|uniref:centromere-associated protein E isoform X2 n=1 Tax=Diprion similis TaxID=362088 RepID=UPI001EF8C91D|nr:centromere-associated protein E isoform X2 [Diprion similis]